MSDNSQYSRDPHPPSAAVAALGAVELGRLLDAGSVSGADVTEALLSRIDAIDRAGPSLRSVLRVNREAAREARDLDAERRAGRRRSPLHGVPILIKDNIDTAGALGTTAGSLALEGWAPVTDSPLVAQLRAAGLLILGKANMSEWANFRGRPSVSGWSAVGGQTLNPFALDRSPGGSSSGSAAGVSAGLAPLAIGTETDGSILCPSAACGLVGLKPTVGLVSRTGIVPISSSQDTAGPIARTVADAAALLSVLASSASDREDAAMAKRPWSAAGGQPNYGAGLAGSLHGRRIGVARGATYFGYHPGTDAAAENAIQALVQAGAELVDVEDLGQHSHDDEMTMLCHEFKSGLDAYLARRLAQRQQAGLTSDGVPSSLAEVVDFIRRTDAEMPDLFPLDVLQRAADSGPEGEESCREARERNWQRTREDGIDEVCARLGLDALVAPTMAPAWPIDHVNGDSHLSAGWSQAAVAGYPSITVPMALVNGMPVGLAIWGGAFSEPTLLHIACALEAQLAWLPTPTFQPRGSLVAQPPPFAS